MRDCSHSILVYGNTEDESYLEMRNNYIFNISLSLIKETRVLCSVKNHYLKIKTKSIHIFSYFHAETLTYGRSLRKKDPQGTNTIVKFFINGIQKLGLC